MNTDLNTEKNKNFWVVFLGIFLLVILIFFGLLEDDKPVFAGTEHNLSGWAWSDMPDGSDQELNSLGGVVGRGAGWISFNSTNCDTDDDGFSGPGAPSGCPAAGTPIPNYGVTVAADGTMSGYAWSEHIGWISFNETTGCPSGPCQPTLNQQSGEVSGWARAYRAIDSEGQTLGGWDGWIHLRGSNYGVSVSGCSWDGWAWGSDIVGWISFRSSGYGVAGSGEACTNAAPSASNLSVSQGDQCSSPLSAIFSWSYSDPDGDPQSAYRVQIDDDFNFGSVDIDSGKVSSSSESYATSALSFDTTYFWRVRVWDSNDTPSSYVEGPDFTTILHAAPDVNFSWDPASPSVGRPVQFSDESQTFGGTTISNWNWDFEDGDPLSSNQQNPISTFSSSGSKIVTLAVTDSDNLTCSESQTVEVGIGLPEWQEITPRQ